MNVRSDNRSTAGPGRNAVAVEPAKRGRGRPLVDDKRRRILDAALRTFAAKGYHGTAVPEVAESAGVGTGTLYRYFEHKGALVNEVYRDAKLRLKAALLDDLAAPDIDELASAEAWFSELWQRLAAFARVEPDAFRFLEMQDHVEYLDARSRELELSVLAPLWLAGKRLRDRVKGPPVDVAIALLWGAFVGLVKANRLGYLPLDDRKLAQAGAAAWRLISAGTASSSRTTSSPRSSSPRSSSPRSSSPRSSSPRSSSPRSPSPRSSSPRSSSARPRTPTSPTFRPSLQSKRTATSRTKTKTTTHSKG